MEKPDVDIIEGLSPAISIDQKGTSKNPRSTVGTVTEVYDYLRLLYARVGHPHCPVCGREVRRQTVDQMADHVEKLPEGTRVMVLGPVVKGRKGEYRSLIEDVRKSGFVRVRVDGSLYEIGEKIPLDKNKKHDIEVVVDRIVVGPEQRTRLVDSIETAARLGGGSVIIVPRQGRRDPDVAGLRVSLRRDERARARAAQLLVQQPARRVPGLHGHRLRSSSSTATWSCPTRRCRCARARSRRGAGRSSSTRSCWRR